MHRSEYFNAIQFAVIVIMMLLLSDVVTTITRISPTFVNSLFPIAHLNANWLTSRSDNHFIILLRHLL